MGREHTGLIIDMQAKANLFCVIIFEVFSKLQSYNSVQVMHFSVCGMVQGLRHPRTQKPILRQAGALTT